MAEMYEIGNKIQLRQEIDQNGRITEFIRSNLSTVDLIPTTYQLSLAQVNTNAWGIKYNIQAGITKYNEALQKYGAGGNVGGLRLFLTDDTVITDSFSNNYDKNVIETGVDSLSGLSTAVQSLRQTSLSVNSEFASNINKSVKSGADVVANKASQLLTSDVELQQAIEAQLKGASHTMADVIFDGKHISLPKIWTSSTYAPSLTLTVKLVSPYGSKKAIKNFIIEPLVYLLALTSPQTNDGISYGLSLPLQVRGYGITNMNLACVQNISMRRGGRETAFNIYKQPLVLDVMITILPLADGFAAVHGSIEDAATLSDADVDLSDTPTSFGPAITTVGNIINSLRPAPRSVVGEKLMSIKAEHESARSSASYAAANA